MSDVADVGFKYQSPRFNTLSDLLNYIGKLEYNGKPLSEYSSLNNYHEHLQAVPEVKRKILEPFVQSNYFRWNIFFRLPGIEILIKDLLEQHIEAALTSELEFEFGNYPEIVGKTSAINAFMRQYLKETRVSFEVLHRVGLIRGDLIKNVISSFLMELADVLDKMSDN